MEIHRKKGKWITVAPPIFAEGCPPKTKDNELIPCSAASSVSQQVEKAFSTRGLPGRPGLQSWLGLLYFAVAHELAHAEMPVQFKENCHFNIGQRQMIAGHRIEGPS